MSGKEKSYITFYYLHIICTKGHPVEVMLYSFIVIFICYIIIIMSHELLYLMMSDDDDDHLPGGISYLNFSQNILSSHWTKGQFLKHNLASGSNSVRTDLSIKTTII